ncbi:MAG: LysM peptidoglycan-binding domain-containing protein [Ilumatobacteraceae bacterium]|jgi:LysM repeat protein
MESIRARRLGVVAGPVLVGALFMASCGADDSAATQSTIDLSAASTAFVVRPPATTTPLNGSVAAGEVVTTEQEYVVQAGDYPLKITEMFGVSLDDLVAYNEWGSANEFPGPGTTIKIPPGGTAPAATGTVESTGDATETATDSATDSAPDAPTATIPDAGDNCGEGTYVIVAGDIPSRVAAKFDVTLDALNAANAGTPGYAGFVVGIEIVIPAKADC